MFTPEQIQRLTQYHIFKCRQVMQLYGSNSSERLIPDDLARCMIDTYRGMNKHFIPTGYELSNFARVFDQSRKGYATYDDVMSTTTRMFLANKKEVSAFR
jgi:hypothetical protein